MTTPFPLDVVVLDPVIRAGRYLAVGVQTAGYFIAQWHVWDADGEYAGYATAPELVPLVIAQHERLTDDQ
ncbi:hypothetical protein I5Q34_08160 [Streptomyces sp. AV19]|uniref:hypothetical protein n=1 Tax=Streptomyces sp. AV19 TaxID=2793068 RepID=UPI0018FEB56D|nr:hypothetical protein [Streptomyces sp. AV19]MBH1934268.1 hypothetical protein [Streptomyces sp. AV19]MDG4533422.1 hypothetical protein [Streptomyces sp. AV19]